MKLRFYSFALLLATTFYSCSDSETIEEETITTSYIIPTLETSNASMNGSRANVNGATGEVSWTAEDALLVFVHESGKKPKTEDEWAQCRHKFVTNSNDYSKHKFAEEASASQPLKLDPDKNYDWYVMSPYTETVKSPENHGQFVIGNQVQDENQPNSHLSATTLMANTLTGIKGQKNISISLRHFATLMTFKLHNKLTTEVTPKFLEFSTESKQPATISGVYNVHFQNGLTPIQTSNQLRLDIKNSKTLSPNGVCEVYAIMEPFTLSPNDKFNIRVVTDKSDNLQTSVMPGSISFKAGTINRANVRITPVSTSTVINPWEVQGETDEEIIIP